MKSTICMHLCRCHVLVLLCLLLSFSRVPAQTLHLYDAIQNTIAHHPVLKEASLMVKAGESHIKTVDNNRLPSLVLNDQLTIGTDNALPGSYFSEGLIPSTSAGITDANNSRANMGNVGIAYSSIPLYNFGYFKAQTKEAKAALATAKARLQSDQYLLTEKVISLYLDWLQKYRLIEIRQKNMDRAATILKSISASVISGLRPGVDSATAGASFSQDRIEYLQAQEDYYKDRIAIATYTGLPSDGLLPDTSLIVNVMGGGILQYTFADTLSNNHPLLQLYQRRYEERLMGDEVISKKYLPKVGFEGAFWARGSSINPEGGYDDAMLSGLGYSRYNYMAGLTFSYNLFNLKKRNTELKEGRYLIEAGKAALSNQQLELNRELREIDAAFEMTKAKLAELPVELKSARMAFDQQMSLFKAGLNTLIDVTNAQYVLSQTETNYILTQDDLLHLLYTRAGINNDLDNFLQHFK